jgi:hypothetical protein
MLTYISTTLASGAIVIPKKDSHQYTTAASKIFNVRNFSRLLQKLVDKHLLGKKQEFGHVGHYVSIHLKMVASGLRLRKLYTPLAEAGKFVYYPLHVPGDMALTLRSPQFLDQLSLIDYLLRIVPHTHKVAIKEHPAMIGRRYDNLVILPPSTNNFAVLSAADAVVSVNSKSGAEAALVGKPTLVLGDAFYRGMPLVVPVDNLTNLPKLLSKALGPTQAGHPASHRANAFASLWKNSHAGELYVTEEANIRTFARSMLDALNRQPGEAAAAAA